MVMKKNIAIVGGSSDIAIATVNHISKEKYNFFALIREQDKSSELSDLGVDVTIGDATSEEDIKNFSNILGVNIEPTTINGGIPFVSSGILANSNAVVVGNLTNGPEIMMLTRAFTN